MGKFTKASDEIQNLVNEIAGELGIAQKGIDFEALCVGKAKDVVEIKRASAVAEYLSNREDLVLVIVFEEAFDKLGFDEKAQKDKYLWLRAAMTKVDMDDNGKITLDAEPTITVPIGFYDKFKGTAIDSALLAKYTIAQIEDERKQKKEAEKQMKKKKRNAGSPTI